MERSTKSHTSSNKIMLHSALFLLALLPNVMSTDEAIVVSCCSINNYSNIDNVLKHAQSMKGTIKIHIQPGNYTISGSYQFHNKSRISIQGSGENATILTCDKPGNGIGFFDSNQIEVRNLSIVGCGAKYASTRSNIKICTEFFPFQAALYFEFCENVTVSSISILHSNRTGVGFFNSIKIFNSELSGVRFGDTPGGLCIEFTGNVPSHKSTNVCGKKSITKGLSMLKATYLLSNCKFLENQEMPGHIIIAHLCNYFPLPGRGSRMTVYFYGNASGHNISICGCTFSRKSAKVGGELFIIHNNKVGLVQCNNCATYTKPSLVSQYSIVGVVTSKFKSRLHGNWAIIRNGNFNNNSAHWGGGLSLCSETVPQGERVTDKVKIQGCCFGKSLARCGAAVDILCQTCDNITSPECSFALKVINCTFLNNQTSHSQTAFQKLNSNNHPCPPGYERKNTSGPCKCPGFSFAGYVVCHPETNSSIFIGYCISYSEIEIKGNSSKQVIVAKCPLFSGFQVSGPTIELPMDVNQLDEDFCTMHWNRTGKLCNKCTNGTGISVFSSTYKCIECTDLTKDWLIYIAVTILPLTLFFIIVVIFQVGVISPQANGYIFFSQIITIPLHELILEAAWALALKDNSTTEHVLNNLLLFPYSVWSFDFFRIFYAKDICLHKSLRIIHVLALEYIPALYPLCLVIISYILIELHARNCRPVVWLWKPFCFLCVRFRRNWEAKTSIIDAFATFLLLSYTKILLVSFSLLTPSDIIIINGSSVGKILYNDPSVDFFQGDHLPFAVLALVILVTIGAIPPLLLLLYPSHTFQRFLNFTKLQSHGLQTFVDAFQGCYKNGADGGPERRYFAGVYFLFRIIVFLIFTITSSIQKMFTALQITYTVFILVFVIFRPYKRGRYNILDAVFITILAVTGTTANYIYTYLLNYTKFLNGLWYFTYALLHIPTLYMAGYIIYWFFIRSRCIQTYCIKKIYQQNQIGGILYHYTHLDQARRPTTFSVSDFPDRVQNPHRYEDPSHLDDEEHENELPHVSEHVSFLEQGRQRGRHKRH